MKKTAKVLVLMLSMTSIQSCQKDTSFLITENSVGPLSQTTKVSELESVFAQDSIVQDTTAIKLGDSNKKIEVFEKGGKHLLTLTPSSDSIPTIENIRIHDPRYVSENGIGLQSTFKDIEKNYKSKKIVTTLNSIVIFPKGSNLYFTIDKQELPSELRFTTSTIEAVQIPDEAKIKYLMLGWE
ncbi:hypothetical protein D2V93_10910 [Flagellimonas taeanensis]|uniref:hypothetical protein n=1 Tax=Flavobacteriaceae TaxID=49546 RepID=UPI000E6A4B7F|nr:MULTISPECIES: hypothetical protein [Allomuricauda]MDC6386047.1 hypothetical protein [Muricauda sp. SK9]RIV50287.1 hypothetical protein D2V93_10910 [Allomuricauda taeanensis]